MATKMATKMATIVGDVTGLHQRHHPQSIPHPDEEIKGKIVSKHCNILKNSGEGFYQPPLPCTNEYEFACASEG